MSRSIYLFVPYANHLLTIHPSPPCAPTTQIETEISTLTLTGIFFSLILLCATQDIAVDGWALTLLSQEQLSYASTAQTIGLNTGYFVSFTIYLALNSAQ
jgi:hypothetical protein